MRGIGDDELVLQPQTFAKPLAVFRLGKHVGINAVGNQSYLARWNSLFDQVVAIGRRVDEQMGRPSVEELF